MRYFLDTQLYSYLANGTIQPVEWRTALGRRKLWLSPITAYELLEGLLHASSRTRPFSLEAMRKAASIPNQQFLRFPGLTTAQVRRWLQAPARREMPSDFYKFRARLDRERRQFIAKIHSMVEVLRHDPARGDPLFSAAWRELAGNRSGDNLDAAFVFHTAILDRAYRVLYKPEKHPSDYLDYLQLQYLEQEEAVFVTADRRLERMTSRSLQSDRIVLWEELPQSGAPGAPVF